jgi:hypothetical protein
MTLYHTFKCSVCQAEIRGPVVSPGDPVRQPGAVFTAVPGVACPQRKVRHAWTQETYVYVGRIPAPPAAMPAAAAPALPTRWVPAEDGGYAVELKYSHIPALVQRQLITALGPVLSGNPKVPLLGAIADRFQTERYADVEDAPIAALPGAEQHLTLPLVLARLDALADALGLGAGDWQQVRIDRQLAGQSADLQLPHAAHGFRFHREALNDMVNPRGGHAVHPPTYADAVAKAIQLRQAGTAADSPGQVTQGYYFYSTVSHRGLNVVLNTDQMAIQTVYYCGAATAWWARAMSNATRLARTVT